MRLKSDVDHVFANGKSHFAYPLKAVVIESGDCRAMFSVPKRLIKKAVHRNLVRRRIKESWRINQINGYNIAWIYVSGEVESFERIENAVKIILEKIGDSTFGVIG